MMRTMALQISETLFQRIEQAAWLAELSTTEFTQQLLRRSLREWTTAKLEQQEIDVWENEQVWGEPRSTSVIAYL